MYLNWCCFSVDTWLFIVFKPLNIKFIVARFTLKRNLLMNGINM